MKKSFLDFNRINIEKLFHYRFTILMIILSFLTFFLLSRLYYLQVLSFEHFDTLSESNRIKYIQVPPRRGIIYDRNNIVIADNSSLYSVEINLEIAKNIKKIINAIDNEIDLTDKEKKNFYKKKLKYSHHNSIVLKSNLTQEEVAKILSIRHKYDGLDVTASLLRNYPYEEITNHVIGSVGYIDKVDLNKIDKKKYKNAKYIGKTGVEKYYENLLFGTPGYRHVEINAKGRQLRDLDKKNAIPGEDIHLTIDVNLQKFVYKKLKDYSGSSIVMNPKNGEILAMVSVPSVNPNNALWKNDQNTETTNFGKSPLFNRSLNGLYSPGSTIKPIIALNGLHNNVVDANDEYYAGPFFQLPDSSRRFRDWKPEGHGMVDMNKAIVQSCDVYFYMLANNLGIKKISSFFKNFSFGQLTGVDLPFESKGVLPSSDWKMKNIGNKWTNGDTVITGIGQGYFLTTPIQLAHAASIIANRGLIKTPKINKNIIYDKNENVIKKEEFLRNNISQENWDRITEAMFNVVNKKNGTAYWVTKNKSNKISGKTGTVQVYALSQDTDIREKDNIPDHLKDHSLYIGFAPKNDPEVVVATVIENIGSGSKYAAPISNQIINYYLDKIRKKY
jgi:penicillin-binding protein 2